MSDPETLIEQLKRSNRRWKALALTLCATFVLLALAQFLGMHRDRMQRALAQREINQAQARANLEASKAAQPR